MKTIIYGSFCLCFIALVFSCSKNEIVPFSNQAVSTRSLLSPPTVQNGILYFTDLIHARAYSDTMRQRVYNSSVSDNVDSLLQIFANTHNINSLWEAEYVDEVDNSKVSSYLSDQTNASDIMKVLLNEDHEVGIGNDVHVYFAENQTYVIEDGDSQTLNNFRSYAKNVDTIPYAVLNDKVLASDGDKILIDHTNNGNITLRSVNVSLDFFVEHPHPCEPWDRIFRTVINVINTNEFQSFTYTRKLFIDGSEYQTSTATVGADTFKTFINILVDTSILSFSGPIEYKATIEYVDPSTGDSIIMERVINHRVPAECTTNERFKSEWDDVTPDLGMSSKLWFKREFGVTWIGAFTETLQWNTSKAKWFRKKGRTEVTVDGIFHDDDEDCTNLETIALTNICLNCKKQLASNSNGSAFTGPRTRVMNEISSTHESQINNVTLTNTLVLDECD